eukprot:Awhi_evm1s7298
MKLRRLSLGQLILKDSMKSENFDEYGESNSPSLGRQNVNAPLFQRFVPAVPKEISDLHELTSEEVVAALYKMKALYEERGLFDERQQAIF